MVKLLVQIDLTYCFKHCWDLIDQEFLLSNDPNPSTHGLLLKETNQCFIKLVPTKRGATETQISHVMGMKSESSATCWIFEMRVMKVWLVALSTGLWPYVVVFP